MRALIRLALFAVLLVLPSCHAKPQGTYTHIVYEVDFAVVRELGWVAPEASDAKAAGAITDRVTARVERLLPGELYDIMCGDGLLTLSLPLLPADKASRLDGALRGMGTVEFAIVSTPSDVLDPPQTPDEAESRWQAWLEANPEKTLADYVLVPFEEGGLHPALSAAQMVPQSRRTQPSDDEPVVFLLRPDGLRNSFTAGDFGRVSLSVDNAGFPAVGFEFVDERKDDFLEFTRRHGGRQMAILVGGKLHSAPTIDEPLPGAGIIRGQFTKRDVKDMVRVLRSDTLGGPLRLVEIARK